MLGTKPTTHWKKSNDSIDFFYVKGIALTLLEKIGLSKTKFTYQKSDIFSEGQTLNIGGKSIVDYGIVKKSITQKFDIEHFGWALKVQFSYKVLIKCPVRLFDLKFLIKKSSKSICKTSWTLEVCSATIRPPPAKF